MKIHTNLIPFWVIIVSTMVGQLLAVQPAAANLGNSEYVAVDPCKIGDTRNLGTLIVANAYVEWLAYGSDLSSQGGLASGCLQPKPGKIPIGIAVTVNAVGTESTGDGNLQLYPADGAPGGVTVVYVQGTNIANSTIVGLCSDGNCDGKVRVESRKADIHVSLIVIGYFYPKPNNVVYVAESGGDYDHPQTAMDNLSDWCSTISADANKRCVIRVAPGLYVGQVVMQNDVSIIGSGVASTQLVHVGEGPVVLAKDVVRAELADLTISHAAFFVGNVNEATGIEIDALNGVTDVSLHDLTVVADGGLVTTTGINIKDGSGVPNSVTARLRSLEVITPAGASPTAIKLSSTVPGVEMSAVKAISAAGTGLHIAAPLVLTSPIVYSAFFGAVADVAASGGVAATFAHVHFAGGIMNFTGGSTITCLSTTVPTATLTTECAIAGGPL